ncbi:MAG: PVC-type heme-binding CxxCH protein [Verrucomicrobiota bacterium]
MVSKRLARQLLGPFLLLATSWNLAAAEEPLIQLSPESRVVWIGNTFAERMQYFGEVESRLHARFPEHKLVVRNIAWPADTVSRRPRPDNFGDIHHYLKGVGADVILACYGFNETWEYGGEAGIDRFRSDLTSFLKQLKAQQYNSESAPQIVLYSPIACEGNRVPDTAGRNRLLKAYGEVMKEVAAGFDVPFIDLFQPSLKLFGGSSELRHTINGMHLTAEGYAKLAPAILDPAVFGTATAPETTRLDAIRREVMEKNDTFFEWYRAVNSLYIHGERRGIHGFFKNERKKLLQMTDVRDQRAWKAAAGEPLPETIDDSSTLQIPNTVKGRNSGISNALTPEEEYAKFEIADGFVVELFASEREIPELRNPVALDFDAEGRMWVATLPSYPHAFPGVEPNDHLLIIEDTDQDGKADKRSIWADNLYLPLGFEFGHGGVYVSQEPNLVFLEDRDRDGKADTETILFHGFGSEDSHHAIHDFVWGPGGGLYMSESTFHNSQVETNRGPVRTKNNAIFRLDPRNDQLDVVSRVPRGGNPWGHAIDRWGEHLFIGDHLNIGLINQPYIDDFFATNAFGGITDDTRFCGQEFITSRHWPEKFRNKVFSNRYKDLQGVLLHDWTEDGATFTHKRIEKVLEAHNKACIPVDLQLGPDGALYVVDWYNPVLGHMQYSLRHERRDKQMGRIWRITYKDRPLDKPAKIAGASVDELLDNLKAYEDRTRYRSRRVLWELPDEELRPALDRWIAGLDESSEDFAHHLTEALWLHQQRGWISEELFQRVSTSPEPRARAAAARLLRYWFEDLPRSRDHLLRLAADDHLKVRLESVVSCTWIDPSVALEVIEIVGGLPQDKALKKSFEYAQRALKPMLKDHPMTIPASELAKRPLSDDVVKALIRRPGLEDSLRSKALSHRSNKDGTSTSVTLVGILLGLDQRGEASLDDWLVILDRSDVPSPDELKPLLDSSTPTLRQAAFAAMLRSGSGVVRDPDGLRAISRLDDAKLRQAFLQPAMTVLNDAKAAPELQQAALFALGRVPGSNEDIFKLLGSRLDSPSLAATAAASLLHRGGEAWPREAASRIVAAQLPKLEQTPIKDRGDARFRHIADLVIAIGKANGLTSEVATVDALKLQPAVVVAVPDKLKFDRETFEVKAGAPIELTLENPDAIAHNLVISAPGSMEKVGTAVDALLVDPKAMERDWIPDLPEVLLHTPMAQAEESVVVRFRAPSESGRYPFICTVPGHWRVMQGYMVVKP